MDYLWIYLIIVAATLIIIRIFSKKNNIRADNGSIAIGESNYGDIKLINDIKTPKEKIFWNAWNIAIGVLTIIGLMLAIWPINK